MHRKWTVKSVLIVLLLSVLLIIIIKIMWGAVKPTVFPGYYSRTKTGGVIEETYTGPGDYSVSSMEISAGNEDIKAYEIAYPTMLKESDLLWPVVVMVNGSDDEATRHWPVFEHLASWGFIVVGNEDKATGTGESASETLDFLLALNEDPDSIFYQKIDIDNIGISGASQGACGAVRAATEFENGSVYKAIYTASLPQYPLAEYAGWTYDIGKVTIPIFMTAGTAKDDAETVAPLDSLIENQDTIAAGVLSVTARRTGASHNQMQAKADGYMTAWFMYMLQGDEQAALAFTGNSPEISINENWQDMTIRSGTIYE